MSQHDDQILHLARYLRPVLPHLDLPEEAIAEVDRLLAQGATAAPALEEILAQHPRTRGWMRQAIWSQERLRSDYTRPAGQAESPRARAYCCPVEGCPTEPYIPFQAGEPIPSCPIHGVALVVCVQ